MSCSAQVAAYASDTPKIECGDAYGYQRVYDKDLSRSGKVPFERVPSVHWW